MAVYLGSDRIGMKGLNAIVPSGYILPSGTYSISSAGLYDIGSYASVDVDVPSPTGTYSISANGLYDIASYASVDVTVGATDIEDALVTHTLSGVYSNSRVTQVGSYAFARCTSLTSVDFPNVSILYESTFAGCYNLASVNFGTVTSIGDYAFAWCSSLTVVNYSECTSLGAYVFRHCTSLISAIFPKVSIVPLECFWGCKNLINVSFPTATILSQYAFEYCTALTMASFPMAQLVSEYAFYCCFQLREVYLPQVSSFKGTQVFSNCYNLISLNLIGVTSVPILTNSNAFTSTPIGGYSASAGQYGSIYVSASLYNDFISASNWSYFSDRIVSV